jgi:hypothetical protein
MAVRPVRFISDVLTRKQILKSDSEDNILFKVSGSLATGGEVSSSFPVTASGLYIDGDAYVSGTITANRMHITEVTTSVYYETSLSASINALLDVSASDAIAGQYLKWNGYNWIPYTLDVSGAIQQRLEEVNNVFLSSNNSVIDYFNSDGTKLLTFNNFGVNDIDFITIDVMIMHSGSNRYTNDLVSISMFINEFGTLSVELNAGALSNQDKFKLLLNKQVASIL